MIAKKNIRTLFEDSMSRIIEKTPAGSFTALINAVKFFSVEQVQKILNNSSYIVNQKDDKCKTALDYALERGNFEIIQTVVNNGGKVSLSFYNANSGANLVKIFHVLKQADYDLNMLDMLGFAPIHYASMKGNEKALRMLVRTKVTLKTFDINGSMPVLLGLEKDKSNFIVRGNC